MFLDWIFHPALKQLDTHIMQIFILPTKTLVRVIQEIIMIISPTEDSLLYSWLTLMDYFSTLNSEAIVRTDTIRMILSDIKRSLIPNAFLKPLDNIQDGKPASYSVGLWLIIFDIILTRDCSTYIIRMIWYDMKRSLFPNIFLKPLDSIQIIFFLCKIITISCNLIALFQHSFIITWKFL